MGDVGSRGWRLRSVQGERAAAGMHYMRED